MSGKKHDFFGGNYSLPKTEEEVLRYWQDNQIFAKSLSKKPSSFKNTEGKGKTFVFYEGPPSANGVPGIHHVLSRAYKDIILRYKTMRGYKVPRKGGWDTHGLPVEIAAEKQLGLSSKKDIEQYGIAQFNQKCKEIVWNYKQEWDKVTKRIGYWLDLSEPYVTYENSYMNSLWWIISKAHQKGLFYKGYKIVPWCARCGTALSSHELAQGYRETTDTSVYIKFRLKAGQKIGDHEVDGATYILSWTTTPWTLPGNVALAVGENIEYALVKDTSGEHYILAVALLEKALAGKQYEVVGKFKGKKLLGFSYEPLFNIKELQTDSAYKVYAADFVTTTDGTGVVHTAVMYGEDDYRLGVSLGLPQFHTVGEDGRFLDSVPVVAGMRAKSKDLGESRKTEEAIFNHLRDKNYLLATENYVHEYPFCWRCDTPLLYYARTSWFMKMSSLRSKMISENKNINWVPGHVKTGRFGEWLKEVKDWNFSRARYWGTPIPLWECEGCNSNLSVSGSLDLHQKMGGSRNNYFAMRHGFPETLMLGVMDNGKGQYHLTPKGVEEVKKTARLLKKNKITKIISSPILRCKETSLVVSGELGVAVEFDERLHEISVGRLEGMPSRAYSDILPTYESRFEGSPEGGESLRDVRSRVWSLLRDLEENYSGENILLVSHEYTIWMLSAAASGWSEKEAIEEKKKRDAKKQPFVKTAQVENLNFLAGPRNIAGEYDLHRPYIDEIKINCPKCKASMKRIPEVADVWFDSGSMPLAQYGYPGMTKGGEKTKSTSAVPYPAGYICEAMDQTRGWFYTLLAVSSLLNLPTPYKNVICLGLINDKAGKKMSKSRGNVVAPMEIADKYGIDALRWYFYTVNPPGETKNFDENEIVKAGRRLHMLAYNSLVFLNTYGKVPSKAPSIKKEIDKWMLARLMEVISGATESLQKYEVREAALLVESLVDDLSRWYIRRNRRRLQKPENDKDLAAVSWVLQEVLLSISKLLAPFTPFFAEGLYKALGGEEQSVHLDSWPSGKKLPASYKKLISDMKNVRDLASAGLAKRAEGNIKVRQPLSKISLSKAAPKLSKEMLSIVAEEVNVKKIEVNPKQKELLVLNLEITKELREEGLVRDLVRAIQELRGSAKLKPSQKISLHLSLSKELQTTLAGWSEVIKREVGASRIEFTLPKNYLARAEYPEENGLKGEIAMGK